MGEEYIMMGAAAFGQPKYADQIRDEFLIRTSEPHEFVAKRNVHKGIGDWAKGKEFADVAASIQLVLEDYLMDLFSWVRRMTGRAHLVYMGGVALNCVANAKLINKNLFENVWIMPNPGDAGSSLGAALRYYGRQVPWEGPYLGTNIDRELDIDGVIAELLDKGICGVANGRAEFGPRALGNRSLLADPRQDNSKVRVNQVKHRQQFRPFAASVLEEHAHAQFQMPLHSSPYMQYTWPVKFPREVPGIVHQDGTSRIQTVSRMQNAAYHELLSRWYQKTGCPMLLNTSLNIKGEPIVDTWVDAVRFQETHGIRVF